ncbi:MAG: hypothetical protein IJ001_02885 [Oscillospiraceae bacterium]|nr:hypothetical protein [Oscillospiraceae bacterium]
MEESFEYTYSAPEQEEIKRIRSKYLPKEETETKMEKLRRLDREAERPGTVIALVLGTVGTLIFGAGMSLCMVWGLLLPGIPVGIVGAATLGMAYPAYARITRKQREKIAPEILKLTEELS